MRICIDAGHGGTDPGAIGIGGRKEKDDTLKMALCLERLFKKGGHEVIMTRRADSYPLLKERVRVANSKEVDLFLSLHRNAFNATANGIEVLLSTKASKKSEQVAKAIQSGLVAVGGRDRGVKRQAKNVFVLDRTAMPACTVELGFVSNEQDNALFDGSFDDYMEAIVNAVENVFGDKGSQTGTTKPQTIKPEPPKPKGFFLSRVLSNKSPRMKGDDVKGVQNLLKQSGHAVGKIDGVFGDATVAAVKAFQKAKGLKADGAVGKDTIVALGGEWKKSKVTTSFAVSQLLKLKSPIMKGNDVKAVQEALTRAGHSPRGVDGQYGKNTVAAVKAFQKAKGLTVDGIVGKKTITALGGVWRG